MIVRRRQFVPELVRNSELALNLSAPELERLDRVGTVVDLAAGSEIIRQGTPGRECFVLIDGKLEVQRGEGRVNDILPGEAAGELAILTGERRNASVVSATRASVYALTPRELHAVLDQCPRLARALLVGAVSRLRASA